ncbi:ER membrane protein complex subunit 6 [Biomphalaria glabrata]|uniref:ER membrane protein complex subunit 6 n=2 Tax=Biomphalaria TaxID=6525 RepID=A0A9W3B2K9_BIOGL|nr:ER membrane protein complex subunit 6-like [Biomphalaria glabrata]KAI8757402.1 ER membrane protein complex subunit 6 [Biomphalaria glabrata]KAI8798893.1 ER membrane protein complex subunit 6 [Biomphalaria glabrata]KAK0064786.1 ER membrane protein complex subunit 6 [Biomphalaria pfeifferi]
MATIAVRTRKSRKSDGIAFSEMSLRQNASVLEYCRTSISALSGATAGIMGLTGLWGFIFYFITAAMLSVLLLLKAGSRWNTFFVTRTVLFSNGLLGGLFTYVLFWTFLYGMVHVY